MVTPNSLLRERLQCISEAMELSSHPQLIADLANEIPHSITLYRNVISSRLPICNCFEYALGVIERYEIRTISRHFDQTFCGSSFVRQLVDSILIPTDVPSTSDLVLYRDGQEFTHAGNFDKHGRIISKWFTGHLWIHDLLEVPAQYGEPTSFYKTPSADEVVNEFIEFARSREGHETIDEFFGNSE